MCMPVNLVTTEGSNLRNKVTPSINPPSRSPDIPSINAVLLHSVILCMLPPLYDHLAMTVLWNGWEGAVVLGRLENSI